MSDGPPDNIDEIRSVVKEHLVENDSVKIVPLTHKDEQRKLYSDDVIKKISRARPQYTVRIVNMILLSIAFAGLAAVSMIIVEYPYNLMLAPIMLIPPTISWIKIVRHGVSHSQKSKLV